MEIARQIWVRNGDKAYIDGNNIKDFQRLKNNSKEKQIQENSWYAGLEK